MSNIQEPNQGESKGSDEYGFDPEARDVLDKDEAQAEASEYGLYGYSDEAGQAFYEQKEIHERGEESEAVAAERHARKAPDGATAQGGKEWNESEHGAGFAQPMQEPQRRSAHSDTPSKEEEE